MMRLIARIDGIDGFVRRRTKSGNSGNPCYNISRLTTHQTKDHLNSYGGIKEVRIVEPASQARV